MDNLVSLIASQPERVSINVERLDEDSDDSYTRATFTWNGTTVTVTDQGLSGGEVLSNGTLYRGAFFKVFPSGRLEETMIPNSPALLPHQE